MKMNLNFLPALVLSLLIIPLFPYLSSADYLIELKNGRTIDARDYKDEGEQIRFTSYGGETVIKKSLIREIKKTEFLPAEGPVYYEEAGAEKPAAPAKDEKTDVTSDAKNKVDIIQKQKEALSKEGEELDKKREGLATDIKREGRFVLPSKKRAFEKRWGTLETEIKEFNKKAEDVDSGEKIIQPEEYKTESPVQETE